MNEAHPWGFKSPNWKAFQSGAAARPEPSGPSFATSPGWAETRIWRLPTWAACGLRCTREGLAAGGGAGADRLHERVGPAVERTDVVGQWIWPLDPATSASKRRHLHRNSTGLRPSAARMGFFWRRNDPMR